MKALAIDPGTNYLGWAVTEEYKIKQFGIGDYTEIHFPEVLSAINKDVKEKIRSFQPKALVMEKQVHFRNATTVRQLIGAYTAVVLAALESNLMIIDIKPKELKMIAGKGNADKWDVAVAVQKIYGLDFDEIAIPVLYKRDDPKGKYKKGDIRDRLYDPADAIALCWAFNKKIKKGAA